MCVCHSVTTNTSACNMRLSSYVLTLDAIICNVSNIFTPKTDLFSINYRRRQCAQPISHFPVR